MPPLPDDERFRLIGAPYTPPVVRRGDWLMDELRGLVEVGGFTDARIPWPHTKKSGRGAIILCAELVRAIRTESALALKYWWGVGDGIVARWRGLLGVRQTGTTGTRRLYQAYKPQKLTDEVTVRGREEALSPESREKNAASKRGQPAPETTRKGLLEAAKRPKSTAWKVQHSEAMHRQWADGTRKPPVWTAEKEKKMLLLFEEGLTAREIAEMIGTTRQAVLSHRKEMRKREKS